MRVLIIIRYATLICSDNELSNRITVAPPSGPASGMTKFVEPRRKPAAKRFVRFKCEDRRTDRGPEPGHCFIVGLV